MLVFWVIIFLMSLFAIIIIVEIMNRVSSMVIWVLLVTEKFDMNID